MSKLRSSAGLTLIELLVTLAIISFVIMAVYTFYLTGLRGWQRGSDQLEAQQSARFAMDKIIGEVRYAHELSLHDGNSEVRFKTGCDIRTLRFRLIGEELVFESYPTGYTGYFHNKIALGITALDFSINDQNLLTVTLSAGQAHGESKLSGSVRPRNLP